MKHHFTGKWLIENVIAYYKPLIESQVLGRHRYWSNFDIGYMDVVPAAISQESKKYGTVGKIRALGIKGHEARLGIDLSPFKIRNKRLLLRNCVEPEVGLHILNQVKEYK